MTETGSYGLQKVLMFVRNRGELSVSLSHALSLSLQLLKSSPSPSTSETDRWSWQCFLTHPSMTTSGIAWWPSETLRRQCFSWIRRIGHLSSLQHRGTHGSNCSASSTWVSNTHTHTRFKQMTTFICANESHTTILLQFEHLVSALCRAATHRDKQAAITSSYGWKANA